MSGSLAPVRAEIAALAVALRREMAEWAETLREEWRYEIGRVHEVLRERDATRDEKAEATRSQRERARARVPDMPVDEWAILRGVVTRHEIAVMGIFTRLDALERLIRSR